MQETGISLLESKKPRLLGALKNAIVDVENHRGDLCLIVKPQSIREVIQFLKNESDERFNMMMDLLGMDYLKYRPEKPERFAVVYVLYSLSKHEHIRIKTFLPEEKPEIDSIHDLYAAANWFEREVWDLFGIGFRNHPNLIRILCHDDFEGHPLRKDYPSDKYQRLKTALPSTGL